MIATLKELIEKEWNVQYETIDESIRLIELAEDIACKCENCTVEEAYNMYIGSQALHLPGLIAFCIVDELGLDPSKVNTGMTIQHILSLPKS